MLHRRVQPTCANLLGLVLACSVARPALGHPHVWITARAEVVFLDGQVTEIHHHWTFDAAYSAYAVQGLGSSDGTLGDGQLRLLAKINTDALGEFGYFTLLTANDQAQAFAPPRDYAMVLNQGQLTLTYTLPLKAPSPRGQALLFEFQDPTYFASFTLAEGDDAVQLVQAPQGCVATVTRPTSALPGQTFSDAFIQALSAQSSFGANAIIKAVITCR